MVYNLQKCHEKQTTKELFQESKETWQLNAKKDTELNVCCKALCNNWEIWMGCED